MEKRTLYCREGFYVYLASRLSWFHYDLRLWVEMGISSKVHHMVQNQSLTNRKAWALNSGFTPDSRFKIPRPCRSWRERKESVEMMIKKFIRVCFVMDLDISISSLLSKIWRIALRISLLSCRPSFWILQVLKMEQTLWSLLELHLRKFLFILGNLCFHIINTSNSSGLRMLQSQV